MQLQEMTSKNIQEMIQTKTMIFIDFWADWCAPCKRFGPVFESVAARHPEITFVKVNTETEADLAAQFGIQSIPTVGIFKDQELIFLEPGAFSEGVLDEIALKVKAINMMELRQEVSAQP